MLDTAIAQSRAAAAEGVHAPRFEIERVIAGSQSILSGAPLDAGPDSPLCADPALRSQLLPQAQSLQTLSTKD